MRRRFIGLVLFAGVAAATQQLPLSAPSVLEDEADEFQFKWPIQKVAVIGAGPSGMASYRELTEAGLDVRVFERDSVPGGIWHYTEEIPFDAPVPNSPSPLSDFIPSLPPAAVDLPFSEEFEDHVDIWRAHRGPKPVWESLTAHVPSLMQRFLNWPWPPGTPWKLTQYQVRNYLRSYASYLHMNSNDENPAIAYNTRVEHVEKRINQAGQEQGWRLWLRSLEPTLSNTVKATWWTEDFDAVAVASGKFSAPSMPSIPGLDAWVQKFPDRIRHSRQYRRPERYENQTVLIIGAGLSGSGISRDINFHARKVYHSYRLPKDGNVNKEKDELNRIPKNTTLIGEVKRFSSILGDSPIESGLVELMNGTILSGIDSVILATGYRYCYPFLSQYYDNATYVPHEGSSPTVSTFLPLDGTHIRDLYLDMFYISDPTLAFVDAVSGPKTFYFADYQVLALAKVWTNTAKLPGVPTMRTLHAKTVEGRGGYGKNSLFLNVERYTGVITYLTGWLNMAAFKYGGKQIDAPPKDFENVWRYWSIARLKEPLQDRLSKKDDVTRVPLAFVLGNETDGEVDHGPIYDDEW